MIFKLFNFNYRLNELQWRNWLAHGTYMTVLSEKCRGCEFEPHLEQLLLSSHRQLLKISIVS